MSSPATGPINMLAILSDEQDQVQLVNASREWRFRFARNYEDAEAILQEGRVEVIVSDYRIDKRHSWRDLLGKRFPLLPPRLVIVADRNADERMWVEVLAEGAFDLLKEPLDRAELGRVLSVARTSLRQPTTLSTGSTAAGEGTAKRNAAAA